MADVFTPSAKLRVKRDGPRGWHWIAAAHYDPSRHELVDHPVPQPESDQPMKRGPGRPRKDQGAQNGNR
ncbi:MAG: hypothetical protein RLZZ524_3106 [Pseudomonadota bacterium]|jgi:hypothetical protein